MDIVFTVPAKCPVSILPRTAQTASEPISPFAKPVQPALLNTLTIMVCSLLSGSRVDERMQSLLHRLCHLRLIAPA